MPKVRERKAGEPITTTRLPSRCPACASFQVTCLDGPLHRLTCRACGWSERYRIREAEMDG